MNSDTSDLANSKLRDVEASANTFFNSIASNFNMVGYNQDILKEYVPALVYTMYDGYYIYSPYTNTLDNTNSNTITISKDNGEIKEIIGSDKELSQNSELDATYQDGERLEGLKPYVYYSCRYQHNRNDFVISYALDNYITIQGMFIIDGKEEWVNESGYLLDNIEDRNGAIYYRNVKIEDSEELTECIDGSNTEYPYIKLNGVKYYKDENDDTWFSIVNGEKYQQPAFQDGNTVAIKYYEDALAFKGRILELRFRRFKSK